jgi:hypothetical protein
MAVVKKAAQAKKPVKAEAPVFQQVFRAVDDLLRKDAGCTSELDYTEQSSWLLFLKYLDALEQDREQEAKLTNRKYEFILDKKYRWSVWAAPRNAQGAIDYNVALTGEDLIEFINGKLFPYLKGFKQRAAGTNTIEYKIGEIFDEVRNRMSSGYNLRDIIDQIDRLQFGSQNQKHELSDLYTVVTKENLEPRHQVPIDNSLPVRGVTASQVMTDYLAWRNWPTDVVNEFSLLVVQEPNGDLRIRHPFLTPDLDGNWTASYWQDRSTGNSDVKWKSPKNGTSTLYNLASLENEDLHTVVICEGPADTISASVALRDYDGVAIIGVPGAQAWRPEYAQMV